MMDWFNKYFHGFMSVGRKPHLFGDERHDMFWRLTSIRWRENIL